MAATQTGTGLPKNTAAALSVLLGPTIIGPILFLLIERDPYVRFYSMQVLVLGLVLLVLQMIFGITIILIPLAGLIGVVAFVLWLILIYKAWQGVEWEIPYIGKWSRKFLGQVK